MNGGRPDLCLGLCKYGGHTFNVPMHNYFLIRCPCRHFNLAQILSLPQNACREVERAISHECRELLPKISAASPREISGLVGSYIMDWTPRLRRHGSKVSKSLKAAASLVRNGDILRETSPDYPKVVAKFFTKVLTGLVGTTSEHKKLTAELRRVRKDTRLNLMLPAGPVQSHPSATERGYDSHAAPTYARPQPRRDENPRNPVARTSFAYNTTHLNGLKALQRQYVNAKLPAGTCWACEFLGLKSNGRHSAKNCNRMGDAERALKDKGLLN